MNLEKPKYRNNCKIEHLGYSDPNQVIGTYKVSNIFTGACKIVTGLSKAIKSTLELNQ